MKTTSPRQQLLRLTGILSQPPTQEHSCGCKPDFRTTRARSLKQVCHHRHVEQRWERKTKKYGSVRYFTTIDFAHAIILPDKEFNKLINTLSTLKKFNQ